MKLESQIRLILVVAFFAAVEALCRFGVIPRAVLIPPSEMVTTLASILAAGTMTADILATLSNVAVATAIVVVLGFVIGAVIHALPWLRSAVEPILASYYAIPTFMFYPVFIVLFGVGNASIIAIAVLLALVAMITATLTGLDRIPPIMRKTARMLQMSRPKAVLLIDLPAAAPYLFTGIKLAVSYAFIGVIASEFILSGSGLGYEIGYAYNNFENAKMYALMLLVLVAVTIINSALNAIDQRLQARRRR